MSLLLSLNDIAPRRPHLSENSFSNVIVCRLCAGLHYAHLLLRYGGQTHPAVPTVFGGDSDLADLNGLCSLSRFSGSSGART